jgi:hypothetical protein
MFDLYVEDAWVPVGRKRKPSICSSLPPIFERTNKLKKISPDTNTKQFFLIILLSSLLLDDQ